MNKNSTMKSKLNQLTSQRSNKSLHSKQPVESNEEIEVKGMSIGDRKGSGFLEAYTRKVKRYAGGITDDLDSKFTKTSQFNQNLTKTDPTRPRHSSNGHYNLTTPTEPYQRKSRLYNNPNYNLTSTEVSKSPSNYLKTSALTHQQQKIIRNRYHH